MAAIATAAELTPDLNVEKYLLSVNDPFSPAIDQIRKLKLTLFHAKRRVRTIMITSAKPGEGKTFIATNLSASIASGVENTALLIDCNFRNPIIAQIFNVDAEKGLSSYLSENIRVGDLLCKTFIQKLGILPMGPAIFGASELVHSSKMRSLVSELGERYDDRYIILDSTAISDTTEPLILAEQVDAIVMVVKGAATTADEVMAAVAALSHVRQKIIGVVLNGYQFKGRL